MSCIHFLLLPCTCGNQLWRGCPRHEPSQIYVETTNGSRRCWSRWLYGSGYETNTKDCQCTRKYRKQRTIETRVQKFLSNVTLSNKSVESESIWIITILSTVSGNNGLADNKSRIRNARHSELTRRPQPDPLQSQAMTPDLVAIHLCLLICSSWLDK